MKEAALLFAIVFLLNVVPAFAPPTWMVFSYVGFRYPAANVLLLATVGALAAVSGRLTLAKFSRAIIRQRFLSEDSKRNIDAIRANLQDKKKLTFGVFLFYAFSPLPSNYVFIAYGLTDMRLSLIAVPFLIGRSISYAFWAQSSSVISRSLFGQSGGALRYLSAYFVVTQFLLLFIVYLFTRIDWHRLFQDRRLHWLPRTPKVPPATNLR